MKYPVSAVIFDPSGNMTSSRKQYELSFPPVKDMYIELAVGDSLVLFLVVAVIVTPQQIDAGLEKETYVVFLHENGMADFWRYMQDRARIGAAAHEFRQDPNWKLSSST